MVLTRMLVLKHPGQEQRSLSPWQGGWLHLGAGGLLLRRNGLFLACVKQGCYDTVRGICLNPVASNIESCSSRQTARQVLPAASLSQHTAAIAGKDGVCSRDTICIQINRFCLWGCFFQHFDLFNGMNLLPCH